MIGINNRDLADFTVDVERTFELLADVPAGKTVVSESGFHTREQLDELERVGVDAVLVGERLMRAPDPEAACRALTGGADRSARPLELTSLLAAILLSLRSSARSARPRTCLHGSSSRPRAHVASSPRCSAAPSPSPRSCSASADGGDTTTVVQQAPLAARRRRAATTTSALTARDIYERDAPGVVFVALEDRPAQRLAASTSAPQRAAGEATGSGFVIDSDGDDPHQRPRRRRRHKVTRPVPDEQDGRRPRSSARDPRPTSRC